MREKIRTFFIRFGQRFDLALGLRKNAADAEAFVDQLCAESRIPRERPLFRAPQGYERDAAPFLVPLIGYEKPLDYPPGQLQLMDELRTHLKSYGSDWLTKITDQDLAGVDFSWMAMLKQFDHWSMLGAGRLGDVPAGDLFRDPLLNYYDLTLWSKLRFAMGLRRGDLLAASAEVRHVADLMRSQRAIIAQLISVSIYRLDSRAREVALAAHRDVTDWQPVDLEQLERYRRVTFASLFFTYPGVAQGVVNKARWPAFRLPALLWWRAWLQIAPSHPTHQRIIFSCCEKQRLRTIARRR